MKPSSALAVAAIVAAVFGLPLWLKSRDGGVAAGQADPPKVPTAEAVARVDAAAPLPKLVDLGTTSCAPCKVMLGVLDELERTHGEAMDIEFVNVHDHPAAARLYGIRAIPTQVFYAPDGRELYRHTGVLRAEEVLAKWAELGYPMPAGDRE